MAISDKLTYLNTTKSQLKDQINYGLPTEKQITSSTTFREYVGSIFEAFLEALRNPDTLFTNLPKTSGSGSQITLNGTAYAPMRITLNPTAISQTTYTGKNLCSSGNQAFTRYIEVAIEPIQAGTYTLSYYCTSTDTDSSKSAIIFADSNSEILTKTLNRGEISTSITLPSTATKMRFYASDTWIHGEGDTATFSNVMVSTNGGTYEPYVGGTASPNPSYPQDIHTISGNNSVVVEGKNLFDQSQNQYLNVSRQCWGTGLNDLITIINTLNEGNYTISYKVKFDTIDSNVSGTRKVGFLLQNSVAGGINTQQDLSVNTTDIYNVSGTFTITASNKGNFTNCYLYARTATSTDMSTTYDFQLEKGKLP